MPDDRTAYAIGMTVAVCLLVTCGHETTAPPRTTISVPQYLNVPYGQTASLPIQLPAPAPAGGVSFTVVSSVPGTVGVASSPVMVAAGEQTANATLTGVLPGSATITVSNPSYVDGVTNATTTASLGFAAPFASLNPSFGTSVTIGFKSNGVAAAAPASGVAVSLTPADPSCVTATSPVTIAAGLVTTTAALSYGGAAALPCTTRLLAQATNIAADSIVVRVDPVPQIIVSGPVTVGSGLQTSVGFQLMAANHGTITVTVTSANAAVLLAPDLATPGQQSITIPVADGAISPGFAVQGADTVSTLATSLVTVSAPGFTSDTATMTVVPPAIRLAGLQSRTTTLSAPDQLHAEIGVPSGNGLDFQGRRAGAGPLTVTFTTPANGVGELLGSGTPGTTQTAQIAEGLYYTPFTAVTAAVAFHPLSTGTTTVSVSAPGVVALPNATDTVVVIQPGIFLPAATVGSGLQGYAGVTLGAPNHGGITLTLTSANAALLLAPDATTPGQQSIAIAVPNGLQSLAYYVQGADTVTAATTSLVTATAPGFQDGTATVTVVPSAIELVGLPDSTTPLSASNAVSASIGLPFGNGLSGQPRRAGAGPLTVTFTTPSGGVGELLKASTPAGTTQTAQIPEGAYSTPLDTNSGGVAFHPLSQGTTTVSVSALGVVTTPNATGTVVVSQPGITVNPVTVGSGLLSGSDFRLGAPNHGAITVTLTSANSSVLLASNATTAGQQAITIPVADKVQDVSFVVQGADTVTAPTTSLVTVSAPGFSNGTATISVKQAGIRLIGLPDSTTTLSGSSPVYAYIGLPTGSGLSVQTRRVGAGPLTVTFVTPGTVGHLLKAGVPAGTTQTAQIAEGAYSTPDTTAGGIAFHPLVTGTTTVSVSAPGVVAPSYATGTVIVRQPGITLTPVSVGSGLQTNSTLKLGAPSHGAITVNLTSSNPAVLLAPDATTPGQQSIAIPVADQVQSVGFYVQGADGITQASTATVTVTAAGFIDATTTATVVQAGVRLVGVPATLATTDTAPDVYAFIGVPSGGGLEFQNRRAGGAALTVTFTTSNVNAASLVTAAQPSGGSSQTVQIVPGAYSTPKNVATGGIGLKPVAAGTSVISVSIPGFTPVTATQSVTVQ